VVFQSEKREGWRQIPAMRNGTGLLMHAKGLNALEEQVKIPLLML
jgi:hypothetical protein